MIIKVGQLKKIIKEATKPRIVKLQVVIQQERDSFTDMISGGTYYDNWATDDPNVETREFPVEAFDEAESWAKSRVAELNDASEVEGPYYEYVIQGTGPGGRKWHAWKLNDEIVYN
jgi:hypothetical protein